jgi:hypothetical protein
VRTRPLAYERGFADLASDLTALADELEEP